MVNVGKPGTRTMPDRWTVVSVDGTRSAHFEHTIAITENGPRVLTALAGAKESTRSGRRDPSVESSVR
jgi:methionyl aminopeptidase